MFLTLVTAFGQLFDPHFALPVIGHWFVFEWSADFLTWTELVSIIGLMAIRLRNLPRGRRAAAAGSSVPRLAGATSSSTHPRRTDLQSDRCADSSTPARRAATTWDFPLTWFLGGAVRRHVRADLENLIYLVAMVKIMISLAWMIMISRNATMGVAWHRFTAWPNIWFKREADGGTALGALQPIMVKGEPIDFENIEELDEDAALGVGKVEDFTWKGLLDFTTCTECGRCQSQCPAWNTEKPLSPKLLIMGLREHAYAKAPYLLASSDEDAASRCPSWCSRSRTSRWSARRTVAVIDPDVLWACTSCGACVQQCPVDIEHVDASWTCAATRC